jgi:hypothetical protein
MIRQVALADNAARFYASGVSPQERVSLTANAWGHNAELWDELHERLKTVMADLHCFTAFGNMKWLEIVATPGPRMADSEQ